MQKRNSKKTENTTTEKSTTGKVRKIFFTILSIICMVVIFLYSSRDAALSTQDSYAVGLTIGNLTIEDFDTWTELEQYQYAGSIDHPVRKTAHFIEYFTLGALLFGAWYDKKHKNLSNVFLPLLIGTLYAITDEIHQLLVSGRAGMVSDVILDACGVLAGVLLIFLIVKLVLKINKR
ncbi:MAG: VanZ family protein [Eubacterium sp.]|nr:VanZ family protein [Eubacterium sp.]